jgi:kynurenine 3-monooxygenase
MSGSKVSTDSTVTLIGAGLAGSLLGILLARRGHRVRIYERLPDLRQEQISAGRSINLALAARGIRALELADVMEAVRPLLIPMPGRMLHDPDGKQTFIAYGQRPEEVIYSVSRPGLNRVLLDAAAAAGVELHFKQSLLAADFAERRLTLIDERNGARQELPLRRIIGTDGAGSVLRRSFVSQLGVPCSEDLLEHGYKELTLPASPNGQHQLDPNALHLWPRGGFMLIALPNTDGSFTVTLFLAYRGDISFATLTSAERVKAFFAEYFPDANALMPSLAQEFFEHPTGVMGTVHCSRWSAGEDMLLLGDAAHAITPFHGQGMNCALEDCVTLDRLFDTAGSWSGALADFDRTRRSDTEAIATMAIENYQEMRDTVRAPKFQLQKALSLELERRFPDRFVPRYSMVMFHDDIPYSVALSRGRIQAEILDSLTATATTLADIDYDRAAASIIQELPALPGK